MVLLSVLMIIFIKDQVIYSAKNFDTYKVYTVVGIMEIEIIGTKSNKSAYSGNNVNKSCGAINIPIRAKPIEKMTVRIFIFVVSSPLESSGRI